MEGLFYFVIAVGQGIISFSVHFLLALWFPFHCAVEKDVRKYFGKRKRVQGPDIS
jgi:hypothetical protein